MFIHHLSKRNRAANFLGLLLLALFSPPAYTQISILDDRGQQISLPQPARRIVSLAPHLTELVFAVGAGKYLIGVSSYSDYPPAARQLPVISHGARADLERIATLQPDLVLAWGSGNARTDIERLEALNIPVFVVELRQLGRVAEILNVLGQLTGHRSQAERVVQTYERDLAALSQQYEKRERVSVFFQIADHPLMTLNGQHMVSHVIRLCGGRNIFAAEALIAPQVGVEDVLRADPEVILISSSLPGVDHQLQYWQGMPKLMAVKNGHVYAVPSALILRPTPRVLEGARLVCEYIDAARNKRQGVAR